MSKKVATEYIMVEIPQKVNPVDLWSSTFFNVFNSTSPWVHSIDTEDWKDWNTTAEVWSDDPDYDGHMDEEIGMYWSWQWWDLPEKYRLASCYRKVFTMHDVLDAYKKILATPMYHCGELVPADPQEWDACCSDYMIQTMMYGKVIYG